MNNGTMLILIGTVIGVCGYMSGNRILGMGGNLLQIIGLFVC